MKAKLKLASAGALRICLVMTACVALVACNGDSSGNKKYSIGGTASGLTGTVVLQNNAGDDLSVSSNGAFTFGKKVRKGKSYAVTVRTQPPGQTCTVANGSGTASADVTNVAVNCTTNPTYSIGGTLSGLGAGLSVVLRNNGGNDLALNANGAFAFSNRVTAGGAYAVTVLTQPTGQTCTVTSGAGIANADVTTVAVNCTTNPVITAYSIGGTVSGLSGGTLQLGLSHPGNMGTSINVTANGAYTFNPDLVANGDNYSVTVVSQPAGQTCSVSNGNGTVAGANVTNVNVSCSAATTLYSIGGTITGLSGTGSGLKIENGASNAVIAAAGATTFTLPNKVANGFEYDVGISQQPTGHTCVLIKSHGVITGADVTNVDVRCISNVTTPIVGTYTVPALVPGSYVYMTLFADGTYVYGSVENNGPNCGASTSPGGNGVEYGVYNYSLETGAFTIKSAVVDTNGGCGVWAGSAARYTGTLSVTGTGQSKVLTLTLPGGAGSFELVPVESVGGQIIGSWAMPYRKNFAVFLPAGGNNLYYMITETQQDTAPTGTGQVAGFEYACASITALTGGTLTADLSATCQAPAPSTNGAVDTSGTSGLSNAGGPILITLTTDTLTHPGGTLTRIKPN